MAEGIDAARFVLQPGIYHLLYAAVDAFVEHLTRSLKTNRNRLPGVLRRLYARSVIRIGSAHLQAYLQAVHQALGIAAVHLLPVFGVALLHLRLQPTESLGAVGILHAKACGFAHSRYIVQPSAYCIDIQHTAAREDSKGLIATSIAVGLPGKPGE